MMPSNAVAPGLLLGPAVLLSQLAPLGPALGEPDGAAALSWLVAGATVAVIVLFVALDLLDDLRRRWQQRRAPQHQLEPGGLLLEEPDNPVRRRHHRTVASAEGSWRGLGARDDVPPAR